MYVIGWVSLTDECIPLEVCVVVEDWHERFKLHFLFFPLSSAICTFSYKNWISTGKINKVSELLERTDSWSDLLVGWRVKVIFFKAYLFRTWQSEKFSWLSGCSSQ